MVRKRKEQMTFGVQSKRKGAEDTRSSGHGDNKRSDWDEGRISKEDKGKREKKKLPVHTTLS